MTATPITPKALAEAIGVDAKVLRSYLRANHARAAEVKNTTWLITPDVVKAAKAHFETRKATA